MLTEGGKRIAEAAHTLGVKFVSHICKQFYTVNLCPTDILLKFRISLKKTTGAQGSNAPGPEHQFGDRAPSMLGVDATPYGELQLRS